MKDGRLNIPLLIALIDAAMQNKEAKQTILKRFLTQYKEELYWDKDFEKWFTEKKEQSQ